MYFIDVLSAIIYSSRDACDVIAGSSLMLKVLDSYCLELMIDKRRNLSPDTIMKEVSNLVSFMSELIQGCSSELLSRFIVSHLRFSGLQYTTFEFILYCFNMVPIGSKFKLIDTCTTLLYGTSILTQIKKYMPK